MLFIPVMVCLCLLSCQFLWLFSWQENWYTCDGKVDFSEAKCQSVIRFFLISKSNSSLLNKNVLISFFKKKKFWPKLFNGIV